MGGSSNLDPRWREAAWLQQQKGAGGNPEAVMAAYAWEIPWEIHGKSDS